MPDEPIAFDSKPTRDDLQAHFERGKADGKGAAVACPRCGTVDARPVAVPNLVACPKCGVIDAGGIA